MPGRDTEAGHGPGRAGSGVEASILIVDHDASTREALADTLETHAPRARVAVASTIQEARAIVRETPIDVVVVDRGGARLDGVGFLRDLHGTRPEIARVMMVSTPDVRSVLAAVNEAKVEAVLCKPFSADELLRHIDEALRARDAVYVDLEKGRSSRGTEGS